MIKFIKENLKQFLAVVVTNLVFFTFLIVAIAGLLINTDSYLLTMSIILGILATYWTILILRKYDKSKAPRIILFVLVYIFGLRYISTFILDPEEVLTVAGIVIGCFIYVYIWNTADTIHNIRVKSRLVLTDLDVK